MIGDKQIETSQKSHKPFKAALLINGIIAFSWWLLFHPGFLSTDSILIIEKARSGNLSSEWTLPWHFSIEVLTLGGRYPSVATLIFSQIFVASVTILAFCISKQKTAFLSSVFMSLTPIVGSMGITLWHDIPMTSGFILFTSGLILLRRNRKGARALLFFGIFLSSFRYNGLPTILIFLLVLIALGYRKRIYTHLLILVFVFFFSNFQLNSIFADVVNVQKVGTIEWMKYDISCYASQSSDELFSRSTGYSSGAWEYWESDSACTWFNTSSVGVGAVETNSNEILLAWTRLARSEPLSVLETHLRRGHYLLPVPIFGLQKVPFLHTNIQDNDSGLSFTFENLANKVRIYPRIWNFLSPITAQSGFWLSLIIWLALKRRLFSDRGIALMSSILTVVLFIFAPIPDVRFSLYILVCGQLMLFQLLIGFWPRRAIKL